MLDDMAISEACLIVNGQHRLRIRLYNGNIQKRLNRIIKGNVLRIDKLGVLTVDKTPSYQYDSTASYIYGATMYTLKIYASGEIKDAGKFLPN